MRAAARSAAALAVVINAPRARQTRGGPIPGLQDDLGRWGREAAVGREEAALALGRLQAAAEAEAARLRAIGVGPVIAEAWGRDVTWRGWRRDVPSCRRELSSALAYSN